MVKPIGKKSPKSQATHLKVHEEALRNLSFNPQMALLPAVDLDSAEDSFQHQIPFCPEFRPTADEFKDFSGYIEKCVSQLGDIGIFKVGSQIAANIWIGYPSTWMVCPEGRVPKAKIQREK